VLPCCRLSPWQIFLFLLLTGLPLGLWWIHLFLRLCTVPCPELLLQAAMHSSLMAIVMVTSLQQVLTNLFKNAPVYGSHPVCFVSSSKGSTPLDGGGP